MDEPGPFAAAVPAQVSYDWLPRRIVIAAIAFALALLAVQAFQAWNGYRTVRSEAEGRVSNLAYLLSAHMQEAAAALDASLAQIAAASARLGGPSGNAGDWNAVLTGAIAGLPNTGSLTVIDSEGIIRHSTVANLLGQSRRDLYLFQMLRQHANSAMVADRPFKSLVTGEMLIPLGRRLEGPADNFQGVAVATWRLPQLRAFYHSIDVGPGGLIRILHPDGQVLFRVPSSQDPIGEPAQQDEVYLAHRAGQTEALLSEDFGPDGRPLITAFHTLSSPGILLAVSLDRRAAFAQWRNNIAADGALLAAELLALAIATTIILQLMRARHAATLHLASRERQLLLAESIAHMGAVTFDVVRKTVRLSPQIATIFGWPEPVEEIPLTQFLSAVAQADRRPLEQAIARCAANGGTYAHEFHITRPDGSTRTIWSEGFQDGGTPTATADIVAICQDVTDRRMAERQLAQAQKMEGVGQLTGGVAHDFNNLLTVIIGNLDMLAEWPGADARARETADMALRAADRGAGLVRSLLAFSRRQPLQPRMVDLNEIVLETDHLLRRTLGEQVELITSPEREIGLTMVDPAQLQAALINLAVNARDSMRQGGKLTIETGNVVLDEKYARQNADAEPGAYVLLAVSDTGSGIPPAILDRVFEPFFTTKETGKGTGLGLSMVYGFIKQSNGHVKIDSEVGHGTTVKLYLPRNETAATAEAPAAASALASPDNETVLVVEDDVMVRDFVVQQLQQLGYRTLLAETGKEALAALDGDAGIDLLLTDVILSGTLTGKQVADAAAQRRPGLRVLFMSGYTENAIVHHGRLDPGVMLLSKPFRATELAQMVRRAIAGNQTTDA